MAENKTVEYTAELQKLFLEIMLDYHESYVRVQNIFNVENFDRSLRGPAEFLKVHAEIYKSLPTIEQTNASFGTTLKKTVGLEEGHRDWFLAEFEGFSKQKELERAILKAADLLEKGDYAPVEKIIKDAVQIGLVKDIGTDYFHDPRARLNAIREGRGQCSTGWPCLDKTLYGGFNRGELNIFCANSGGGKSLFLMNLCVNWFTTGLNGMYLSLELSEELCSMRADAMVTNMGTKDIFKNLDDVELKVGMTRKKSGNFQIKYIPAQSNVNDIRSFIREYQIQTGVKIDFLIVDYLDLLSPAGVKIDPTNLFVKDKFVSEELRNLAKELNVLFVTASQFNRGGVDEVEFDHTNISGGISKINTADNVFGIFTSRAMKERGKFQLQLLKTRSSSGVGMKVELDYNIDSLRITDSGTGEETEHHANPTLSESILGKLKSKSIVSDAPSCIAPIGEVEAIKVKAMLAGLRTVKK
jgi:hypothetical protein